MNTWSPPPRLVLVEHLAAAKLQPRHAVEQHLELVGRHVAEHVEVLQPQQRVLAAERRRRRRRHHGAGVPRRRIGRSPPRAAAGGGRARAAARAGRRAAPAPPPAAAGGRRPAWCGCRPPCRPLRSRPGSAWRSAGPSCRAAAPSGFVSRRAASPRCSRPGARPASTRSNAVLRANRSGQFVSGCPRRRGSRFGARGVPGPNCSVRPSRQPARNTMRAKARMARPPPRKSIIGAEITAAGEQLRPPRQQPQRRDGRPWNARASATFGHRGPGRHAGPAAVPHH